MSMRTNKRGSSTPDSVGLKPQLDEHQGKDGLARGGGLRGQDKRQAALEDAAPRGSGKEQTVEELRTRHEEGQSGADVRAPLIKPAGTPPEGLVRERTRPLGPKDGRGGDVPGHVPASKPKGNG